jgi:hypothetical protein
MRALYNMFMRSWVILGSNAHIICSKHNTSGEDVTTSLIICFLIYGVWLYLCIIQCTYTSFTTFANYGVMLLMKFGFSGPLSLTTQHNWYVLVMIEHFSKWLELVLLLDLNNKGGAYAFWDKVLSRFGALVKVFTHQGTKFCGDFQKLCERH